MLRFSVYMLLSSAIVDAVVGVGQWKILGDEDKFYYFSSQQRRNYNQASDLCVDRGGHLVVINSEAENNLLFDNALSDAHDRVWIGSFYANSVIQWVDGSSRCYQKWESLPSGRQSNWGYIILRSTNSARTWSRTANRGERYDFICEVEDPCLSEPCLNGGTCRANDYSGAIAYSCLCRPNTRGDRCETIGISAGAIVCHLKGYECGHGGTCVETAELFRRECICIAGYTGDDCLTDIDECADVELNDCHPVRQQCVNSDGGYECSCAGGFTGGTCETHHQTCENNYPELCNEPSNCKPIGQYEYMCVCPPGRTGTHCETPIDECKSNPCENGATCTEGPLSFTCTCTPGYQGPRCSDDIDECEDGFVCADESTPRCVNTVGSYTCCAIGLTGPNCVVDINECDTSKSCNFNGQCINKFGGYDCVCNGDFDDRLYCASPVCSSTTVGTRRATASPAVTSATTSRVGTGALGTNRPGNDAPSTSATNTDAAVGRSTTVESMDTTVPTAEERASESASGLEFSWLHAVAVVVGVVILCLVVILYLIHRWKKGLNTSQKYSSQAYSSQAYSSQAYSGIESEAPTDYEFSHDDASVDANTTASEASVFGPNESNDIDSYNASSLISNSVHSGP